LATRQASVFALCRAWQFTWLARSVLHFCSSPCAVKSGIINPASSFCHRPPDLSTFSSTESDDVHGGGGWHWRYDCCVHHPPMSKEKARRGDTPPPAQSMATLWASRGYQHPSEDTRHNQVEDPKGEEAYQRRFAEAAKLKPPRVPNAAFYENSPSAMEYLRKRDQELFSRSEAVSEPDQRQRNPNFVPISKDLHRASRSSLSPAESASHPQPLANPAGRAPLAMTPGAPTNQSGQARASLPRTSDPSQRFADPRQFQGQAPALPMTLEPSFGPTGPGRMLR
jgi:hypothetical protein